MYDISLDQFAILATDIVDSEVSINVGLGFRHTEEGRKIACTINYELYNKEKKLLVMQVTCAFEIQKDDWKKLCKDRIVQIPKSLLEYFAVHTIGTSRGIMFCKTERTVYNRIIIPPINVSAMIEKGLTIKLQDISK